MNSTAIEPAPSTETGSIGIMHLKRYWQRSMGVRQGIYSDKAFHGEWNLDKIMFGALGFGIGQIYSYLYGDTPTFEEFEQWVLEKNKGHISPETIADFNNLITSGNNIEQPLPENFVLTAEDLLFWEEHGYIIIHNAVSREDCDAAIDAICNFINIKRNEPETWYNQHPARHGIMVEFFQHPALQKNRRSEKIRRAFEQLLNTTQVWPNTDRVSFNPPEHGKWTFPGPHLHWDVRSFQTPIPFGLQGLLYLSDTEENQGAFTLVPGFHHKIDTWLNSLPPGTDPQLENLYKLGPKPIAARAGDFIIWHHALPHSSSPNTSKVPRIVQYINYLPVDKDYTGS